MKKHFIDSSLGFLIGLIYFFGSAFLNLEWIGVSLMDKLDLEGISGLLLFGIFFAFLSSIPFLLYFILPVYKKLHTLSSFKTSALSFLLFALGTYIAFLVYLGVALIGFSRGHFSL